MLKLLRTLFRPSKVYVVINRIEYADGARMSQIISIMVSQKKAKLFVDKLRIEMEKIQKATNVKAVTFEYNEYALE